MTTDHRLLLKPAEVAERLGIAVSTVYMLCQRGELPTLKIHSSVRVPLGALNRWVAEHTETNGQPPSGQAAA